MLWLNMGVAAMGAEGSRGNDVCLATVGIGGAARYLSLALWRKSADFRLLSTMAIPMHGFL